MSAPLPKPGNLFKHYRGSTYRVIGIGKLESTEEDMVVYQEIFRGLETGEGKIWIRPVHEFTGEVEYKEKPIPRFKFVSDR
jgi:hypothetical protein